MKLLRSSDLVHVNETLEKFGLSSIFSECGIFFRGPHLVHFDETLEKLGLSSIFSKVWNFSEVHT